MQEYTNGTSCAVCVLGGDGRTEAMVQRLKQLGCQVNWCAHAGKSDRRAHVREAVAASHAVILPTPAFREDMYVYGSDEPIHASQLFDMAKPTSVIWGGRLTEAAVCAASRAGLQMIDYMALEEVQQRNAVPSAEGAIMLAMQALEVTLDGARAAVLGYGRIGRALAERLQSWGCTVGVAARKSADLVRISLAHATPIPLTPEGVRTVAEGYDVIFNTVPARILNEEILASIPQSTLMIELASAPGGWSPECAAALGKRVIYAPGLPAKYAPRSAGMLIADAIYPRLWGKEVREG